VASQRDVRTTLSDELEDVLSRQGLPLLDGLTSRVAYARSMSEGETVLDGYDTKAKAEVEALLKDVGRILS
jgi:chromosome partitioning protein